MYPCKSSVLLVVPQYMFFVALIYTCVCGIYMHMCLSECACMRMRVCFIRFYCVVVTVYASVYVYQLLLSTPTSASAL